MTRQSTRSARNAASGAGEISYRSTAINVLLWTNRSSRADALVRALCSNGYRVDRRYSEMEPPTFWMKPTLITGYGDIETFVSRHRGLVPSAP